MIPSVLAQHVEQGIKDFLRTSFPVTTPFFSNMLDSFLDYETFESYTALGMEAPTKTRTGRERQGLFRFDDPG